MNTHKSAPLKIKPTSQDKQTGTAKRKPTRLAKEPSVAFEFSDFAFKMLRLALGELYCKPSREKWLTETPEKGNERGQFYDGALLMSDKGGEVKEVDLTRDEYDELKEHLAFLRRIRRLELKRRPRKENSK